MKTLARLLLVALLSLSLGLVGCANIQNDAARTKAEGTLAGAGVGAVLGGIFGYLIGGSRGAAAGAALGLAAGTATGYLVGKHVADKKAQYASREEWLDACIAHSQKINVATREYNDKLAREIAALDQESATLLARYQRRETRLAALKKEQKRVQTLQKDAEQVAAKLEEDRIKQQQAAADARKGGNTTQAKALDAEIDSLDKQIQQMKEYNRKLANISVRLSV